MPFSLGQAGTLNVRAAFEPIFERSERESCICLVMSTTGRAKVSVIAQRQEPGSIPGPSKESRGQSGYSGMSKGTMVGDEVREVRD